MTEAAAAATFAAVAADNSGKLALEELLSALAAAGDVADRAEVEALFKRLPGSARAAVAPLLRQLAAERPPAAEAAREAGVAVRRAEHLGVIWDAQRDSMHHERMTALAAQHPAWGAQMEYAKGESSDDEIDGLDDSQLVPPWLMGAAAAGGGRGRRGRRGPPFGSGSGEDSGSDESEEDSD